MYFSASRNARIGTLEDFIRITNRVSLENYNGNVVVHHDAHNTGGRNFRARLSVNNSYEYGARVSWSGRHIGAASWEAYRDVLKDWFDEFPDSKVKTSLAVYAGKDEFEQNYPATAYVNIGSMMNPAYMRDLSVEGD